MVLADTSVWIEHLRKSHTQFAAVLSEGFILLHPFVSGELACGNLKNRTSFLDDLQTLPCARLATHSEVVSLVNRRNLWGRGLGWVDAHLLASALLTHCGLWTLDRKLDQAARDLGIN